MEDEALKKLKKALKRERVSQADLERARATCFDACAGVTSDTVLALHFFRDLILLPFIHRLDSAVVLKGPTAIAKSLFRFTNRMCFISALILNCCALFHFLSLVSIALRLSSGSFAYSSVMVLRWEIIWSAMAFTISKSRRAVGRSSLRSIVPGCTASFPITRTMSRDC